MPITKSRIAMLSKVLRIVYAGVLLFHLLLWALNVKGQNFQPGAAGQSKHAITESKRSLLRKIYTSQIGVREKGTNAGPEVENYLRYVKLPKGNPWCAAFVCWALGQAGIPDPRSGWSPDLLPATRVIWTQGHSDPALRPSAPGAKRSGQLSSSYLPQPSDVFGLYFPEKGRIAHVGFIDEWNDPWVNTVEGNTNILGSREGDGVYRKRRLARSIYKVARYIN